MGDPLYILIIGHNLQAKCDIANSFIKQKNAFKQFSCRQNLLIKRMVGGKATPTVAGRPINIVLTPNLNTPGWTHLNKGIFNSYANRVFVYVKAPGLVDVNDAESIKNLSTKFKGTNVHTIKYLENENDTDPTTAEFEYLPKGMTPAQKKQIIDNVLTTIGKAQRRNIKINNAENDEVSSKSVVTPLQERSKTSSSGSSGEDQVLESVTTFERKDTKEIELPTEIKGEHWILLSKTLKHGRAKSNHVRVNMIGNQGAGKTTIVSKLHKLEVKCPDEQQEPTEALEISEISSRCIEINGEKHWETKPEGYTEDLNVQRMAQAMKAVQRDLEESSEKSGDIDEEDFETLEYQLGSNVEDDIEVATQEPYTAINKEKSRVRYLKNILRKKDHSSGERMYISYWDFAGQSTYYSTHQVFMSPSAVYVLVVDLSMDFKEKLSDSLHFRTGIIKDCSIAESLMFWISSIKAFTTDTKGGRAPVIIVGTHVDKIRQKATENKLTEEEEIRKKFDEVREIIKMSEVECVAVDNTKPDKTVLHNLRNRILELGLGVIDEEIPAQWIDLDRKIQEHKLKGTVFMSFTDLQDLDKSMDEPMKDKTRLDAFLGHQHNRGHLIHFSHPELKDLIILEPDVLAKFLNNLMRSRDQQGQKKMEHHTGMYNHNGIINYDYIMEAAKLLSEYKGMQDNVDKLLNMLIQLSIIRPYKSDEDVTKYLLPCLLPHREEEAKDNAIGHIFERRKFQIVFPDNHMPPTFFHVLIGGLLNEWKLVERDMKPEIYNLYACFRLATETQQMAIFWEASRVYIVINNFSKKHTLQNQKLFDILETLEKRIEEIFYVYRHTNKIYEIRVQCPKHESDFLSLSTLKRDGEAMCYGKPEHAVDCDDIFGENTLLKQTSEIFRRKPTDVDLGRLATYLVREDSTTLAARLRMYMGQVEADRAAQTSSDKSYRRLQILFRWRASNGSDTIGDLLEMLTVTKDYQTGELQGRLSSSPATQTYDLPDTKLDCIPKANDDLKVASNSIGALYPFLMLELGLLFKDIQQEMFNNPNDMWKIIFTLLSKWRKQNPDMSTTRVLLDTASFVGTDTTEMQKGIFKY